MSARSASAQTAFGPMVIAAVERCKWYADDVVVEALAGYPALWIAGLCLLAERVFHRHVVTSEGGR